MNRLLQASRHFGTVVERLSRGVGLAFICSCALSLPTELAPVRQPSLCDTWTLGDAVRVGRRADRQTSLQDLECIIFLLRREWLQTPEQASIACRVCFLLADVEPDPERRKLLAAEGARWGELAESLGAVSEAATLYYHAMNLGLAVRDDIVLALRNLSRIEALLTLAAYLDPSVDQGGPVRVLGMLYIQAPAWPQGIGDPERGLGLLHYAIRHFPGHPLNHLFFAQALWQTEGESQSIQKPVCEALRLSAAPKWGDAGKSWQKQAEELAQEAGVTCAPISSALADKLLGVERPRLNPIIAY